MTPSVEFEKLWNLQGVAGLSSLVLNATTILASCADPLGSPLSYLTHKINVMTQHFKFLGICDFYVTLPPLLCCNIRAINGMLVSPLID